MDYWRSKASYVYTRLAQGLADAFPEMDIEEIQEILYDSALVEILGDYYASSAAGDPFASGAAGDMDDYNVIISNNEIIHIINEHGNPKIEIPRGHLPVGEAEILSIPQVFYDPDKIINTKEYDDSKRLVIRFEKQINGYMVVASGVTDGRHSLTIDSLRIINKKRPPNYATMDNMYPSAHTSETLSRSVSLSDKISQPDSSVNSEVKQGVRKNGSMFSYVDRLPDGYTYDKNATTAPLGYRWASNNKSRFSGERESILVKEDDYSAIPGESASTATAGIPPGDVTQGVAPEVVPRDALPQGGADAAASGVFKPYTEHEISNLFSHRGFVAGKDRYEDFVSEALDSPKGYKRYYFGKINDALAEDVRASTGLDVHDYNVLISNNEINHIINEHSDSTTEMPRGQLPVGEIEILSIPQAFDAPDKIIDTKDYDSSQRPIIQFIKKENGKNIVATGISDGRKAIIVDSYWIINNKGRFSDAQLNNSPVQNVRNGTAQAFIDKNIPQSDDSVNIETKKEGRSAAFPNERVPAQTPERSEVERAALKSVTEAGGKVIVEGDGYTAVYTPVEKKDISRATRAAVKALAELGFEATVYDGMLGVLTDNKAGSVAGDFEAFASGDIYIKNDWRNGKAEDGMRAAGEVALSLYC